MYSVDDYDIDELYENETSGEKWCKTTRDRSIKRYRVKTVKSGDMLECEIYPVWDTRSALSRIPKSKKSRTAQRNLNRKNAIKQLVRLINTNFTPGVDIWFHGTYDEEHKPATIQRAERCMANYIRRLKRYAARQGWPDLKYVYVTHRGTKNGRIHQHLAINFPDRDAAEALWTYGAYPRANRLQDGVCKFEGMARYMATGADGTKRYVASRNLQKPIITRSDCKMTRGGVMKLIRGDKDPQLTFERLYKQYQYTDMTAYTSDYVSGAYLYVRMRRRL